MVDKSQFEKDGYLITVHSRNVLVTDAMKRHAIDKISKIDRFHSDILDVVVTLDIQKIEHIADILMKVGHFIIKVSGVTTDMYASIDQAASKLQQKLSRWKERIKYHHRPAVEEPEMQVDIFEVFADDIDDFNEEIEEAEKKAHDYSRPLKKIVGTETLPLKTLTSEEAVLKMELSDDHFLIFRGEEDRNLKVIYRRDDGNYGIVQTK
jgi:ribosome hibernation promoting factor